MRRSWKLSGLGGAACPPNDAFDASPPAQPQIMLCRRRSVDSR